MILSHWSRNVLLLSLFFLFSELHDQKNRKRHRDKWWVSGRITVGGSIVGERVLTIEIKHGPRHELSSKDSVQRVGSKPRAGWASQRQGGVSHSS